MSEIEIVFWGDSHIPYRAEDLPRVFIDFLRKIRPKIMVVTGDLVIIDVLKRVEDLADRVIAVRGNMDEGEAYNLPLIQDFSVGDIKFTVFHGHGIYPRGDPQQLYEIAKKRKANVIITGHTHYPELREYKGILILNPGSVCGVYGGAGGYGYPTWGFLRIIEDKRILETNIYVYREGRVDLYEKRAF